MMSFDEFIYTAILSIKVIANFKSPVLNLRVMRTTIYPEPFAMQSFKNSLLSSFTNH